MAWQRADDLSGATDDVRQVTFGLDGQAYIIDLGSANHDRLRELLAEFVGAAAPYGELPAPPERDAPPVSPAAHTNGTRDAAANGATGNGAGKSVGTGRRVVRQTPQGATVTGTTKRPRRSRRGPTAPVPAPVTNQTIRAWARENGFEVSDTGRISGEVLTAYEAAH